MDMAGQLHPGLGEFTCYNIFISLLTVVIGKVQSSTQHLWPVFIDVLSTAVKGGYESNCMLDAFSPATID